MEEKKRKKAAVGTLIAVIFMIISMLGASLVQTSAGKVKVKDLRFETTMGYEMSALLYRPVSATAENKAPAVITCHGMYNNREMQDINLVELSRRGYVVLSIDMFSHGNSENLKTADALPMGVTEALKMLSSLDYVDTERIGLTGHSMGGMNCDVATLLDNQNEQLLVAALLLNSCFATYQDTETGTYINAYGSRDVGIIAAQYDEFLFKEVNADGTALLAKDFIQSDNAQSFLNFGKDPAGQEYRNANEVYHEEIDGNDAMRVIYNPAITHPWSHFSKRSAAATIAFFDESLTSPNPIDAGNQIWQWKEFFNLAGLIGFAVFALNITLLLTHTPIFSCLREKETVKVRMISAARKKWNLIMLAATVAFCTLTYLPIVTGLKSDNNGKLIFSQNTTFGIGVWAALCGGFMLLCMLICYKVSGRKEPISLEDIGVSISRKKLGMTILLALLTVGLTWLWVAIADYFFKTDFRIWVLAAKTFGADKFRIALFPSIWLFLVYYIANAMFVNCFNYYTGESKKAQIGNTCIQAIVAVLPSAILVAMQYIHLFATGTVLFENNNAHSMILWLFPMIVLIPAATVIGRKIYKETKNPYLPGIISGILVTFITCINTSTWI